MINLTKGWIKISKKELDTLRKGIFESYIRNGGTKLIDDFNTHLPNYEELIFLIKKRLNEFQELKNIKILIDGNYMKNIAPGKTFLKHLFYTKKNEDQAQFQKININLCYLFAFEQTREKIWLEKNYNKKNNSNSNTEKGNKKTEFKISFTYNNLNEAGKIETFFKNKFDVALENDVRNSPIFNKGTIKELFNSLSENEYVIMLLSRDYLQNEECMKDLIDYTTNHFETYQKKAINILLPDIYEGEFNVFSTLGKMALSVHWKLHIEKLEKAFSQVIEVKNNKDNTEDKLLHEIHDKIEKVKIIKKEIFNLLHKITNTKSTIRYDMFFQKIKTFDNLLKLVPIKKKEKSIDIENIYNSIQIPSNNNPNEPEFPPKPYFKPKFPASETYKINVPGFTNVWLKDESTNPTGTHKDRFAWEVVIKYKALLDSFRFKKETNLPQISIISSGGAATAVQNLFNIFEIPINLKVLVDYNTSNTIKESLTKIGCKIYETNLSSSLLKPDDIKRLTENNNGIDITYRETLDPNLDNYYDWLSYEIINQKADYCFIPFGTGDLFINVLNMVKKEYFNSFLNNPDPRFYASIKNLSNCNFIGARSVYKKTVLDKLFSSYLPTFNEYVDFIDELKSYSCIGNETQIEIINEKYVDEAINIMTKQNIIFEPSGIAGVVMLLQMKDTIPKDKKILIINTGKTKSADTLMENLKQIKT